MLDTISAKALITSTLDAANFDAANTRSFPRVASIDKSERRQSLHIGSLSPTVLRISHQPRKSDVDVQRSLVAIDQTLTRLDAQSNPIGSTKFKVAIQADIPSDVTLAEFRAAALLLFGFLLETDGAALTSVYNGEQ